MRAQRLLPALVLSAVHVSARRSMQHVGLRDIGPRASPAERRDPGYAHDIEQRATAQPLFLNSNTSRFSVDGTKIPEVDFDVGESYAGLLPISGDPKEESQLFWWFFPSPNQADKKEILIWLNGGVSLRLACGRPDLY